MLLNERIENIVREVLNEELGINKDVYNAANEILNLIHKNIEEKEYHNEYERALDDTAFVIKGEFEYSFQDVSINIHYYSYIFRDLYSYKNAIKRYGQKVYNAYALYNGKDDTILSVSYNRTFESGYDESIRDRIQHELTHIFQSAKINGQLTSSNLGKKVHNALNKRGKDPLIYDKDIRRCAYLLYYCKHYEQDAFANGLYNWLMNSNQSSEQVLEQSAIYRNIEKIKRHIAYLQGIYNSNDEKTKKKIEGYYGLRVGEIINKGFHAIERTKKLINRILYKYANDTGTRPKFIE